MLESFLAVPLHFTVEFLGFLVAAGGALLLLSRPTLARPTLLPGALSTRVLAALGLGVLAAAQLVHGGALIASLAYEGEPVLIGMRTAGFALLLMAVLRGARVAVWVVAPVSLRQPPALVPAVAAAVLSAVCWVGARRTGHPSLRRLSGGAAVLALSEVLTAIASPIGFAGGAPDTFAVSAHVCKLLGFGLFGAWLWSGVRSSIRTRFVASFAVLLLAVVMVLSSGLTGVLISEAQESELGRLTSQLESIVATIEEQQTREVKSDVLQMAGLAEEAIARGRDLDRLARSLIGEGLFGVRFVVIQDETGLHHAGRGPVKAGSAPRTAPPLDRQLALRIAGHGFVKRAGEQRFAAASVVKLADDPATRGVGTLAVLGAGELRSASGRHLGVAVAGLYVDQKALENLANSVGSPVVLMEEKGILAAGPGAGHVARVMPRGLSSRSSTNSVTFDRTQGGVRYLSAATMLQTSDRRPLQAPLVVASNPDATPEGLVNVSRVLFLVTMGVGVVALALAWLFGRRIARPIHDLTLAANAVREGDLQAHANVSGSDEVGHLGETFNDMTAALYRMTRDLRKAVRDEHDLRARIETIVNSMADGLVAVDARRNVLAFNPEAERLVNVAADEAMGRGVEDVVDVRDARGMRARPPIYDLAEGSVGDVYLERRDGGRVPVAITSAVLRDRRGEVTGAVAVIRDMTREREVERIKSQFLANISHELRTPLTPIKGYAELLARPDVAPKKSQRFVEGIRKSTERLERIVELLVDYAALEGGRLSPRAGWVDLGSMVAGLAEELRRRAPQHEVIAEVKSELPKVLGDERLLRRSLEEILDNAVKFSPQGGTIRLEARGLGGENGLARSSVEVAVSDEGIGIPPEHLDKIFADFHQIDGSDTRTYGGLGLGLAFVQRIVEAHEGRVVVDSHPEGGTRLSITIPASR